MIWNRKDLKPIKDSKQRKNFKQSMYNRKEVKEQTFETDKWFEPYEEFGFEKEEGIETQKEDKMEIENTCALTEGIDQRRRYQGKESQRATER